MLTMVVYASRMAVTSPDPHRITRYWLDRADDLLNGCVRDRDVLPAEQSIDVRFDRLHGRRAGHDRGRSTTWPASRSTTTCARRWQQFIAEHPRGRYGEVIYEPDDLGLDVAEVAERFRSYSERFITNHPAAAPNPQ